MGGKKPSSSASASAAPISIGNCEVVVQANNFNTQSDHNTLQISLSTNSNIIISGYYFVLVNPKDSDAQSKSLLQEVLTLYVKELPSMNYAANTGKKSMFLERCVSNGKYCTLVLKSKSEEGSGEVVAAISFQIIPADTRFAEVPLAAVSSVYQHKGIGQLTYSEMRKRLQSVGVHSIFCWADVESEAFWVRQGFVSVGKVDDKGRARKLPIKADIRKSLCFPGGSTLMVAHLTKENTDNSTNTLQPSSLLKPGDEKTLKNNSLIESSEDLVCLYSQEGVNTGNAVDERRCSCSSSGAKKRTWEASHTSLKSKKVKGGHLIVCQSDSGCVSKSNERCMGLSPITVSMNKGLADITPTLGGPLSNDNTQKTSCYNIMLMNIVDDAKISNLTKIIEDLGGSVTSDGRVSTHVITGKVRKTLNFCTALCSGAWVISSAWLKESFREGRFVDEMPYILKDDEYESKYRTDLKGTVLRARGNNTGGFLKNFQVCLAAHVQPPVNTLSAIVKSAGGNVIRKLEKVKDPTRSIYVASEDNMEEALLAIKKGIATFSNEWFMNCVMKQHLDLDAPQFAESL
ncbi:putative transcription regulator GNAT family [Helianthus anomalus]